MDRREVFKDILGYGHERVERRLRDAGSHHASPSSNADYFYTTSSRCWHDGRQKEMNKLIRLLTVYFVIMFAALMVNTIVHETTHILQVKYKGGNITEICFLGHKNTSVSITSNPPLAWVIYNLDYDESDDEYNNDELYASIFGIVLSVTVTVVLTAALLVKGDHSSNDMRHLQTAC